MARVDVCLLVLIDHHRIAAKTPDAQFTHHFFFKFSRKDLQDETHAKGRRGMGVFHRRRIDGLSPAYRTAKL